MKISSQLNQPGEHQLTLQGLAGTIEAILTVPNEWHQPFIAILGHPHSLQGGSMNNKVVTTMARAFRDTGIPSLRFNFRGVGQSEGVYDAGLGESEDMLALVALLQKEYPSARFIFAGFSFGSYVTYRAACHCEHALLISIAPSVARYDYQAFSPQPKPWIIVHGDEDEVAPLSDVLEFVAQEPAVTRLIRYPKASHFFHGGLLELKTDLIDAIKQTVFVS